MSEGIKQRLLEIKNLHHDNRVVTYGEFVAFNELLNHLPALGFHFQVENNNKISDFVIRDACRKKGAPINKDELKIATMSVANNVSPLEVDVIFTIFDFNKFSFFSHFFLTYIETAELTIKTFSL
jgi:hypothetical protein